MAKIRKMIGPMALVWTLGMGAGAVVFVLGVMYLVSLIARWSGSGLAMALYLPVSMFVGMGSWMFVLAGTWRLRRNYLRRAGIACSAIVVESDLRYKRHQGVLDFGLWRLRIEARFPHPDSGGDALTKKEYSYPGFRASKARALAERLSVGSTIPVVVRKNSALLDIPERPVWADIW